MIRETAAARAGSRRLPPGPPSPLALALGPIPADRSPASVVGLEHEYSLTAGGKQIDFRTFIHDLHVPGRRLDPGDVNAYRGPSGLAITCDAEDAEVVSPPVAVRPGFAAEVEAWAAHGRSALLRLLPVGLTVIPYSTHLSASMPDDIVDAACDLFARTFTSALTLMLGGADSHGVFVRPRSGRLEVCGEHAGGARLGAAAVLVAGGARACATGNVPPLLAVDVQPARGRRGLFVGRHVAFGRDLFDAGPAGDLPLLDGGTIPAAEHLMAVWEAVRLALGADAGAADLRAGDAIVSGAIPVETDGVDEIGPSPFGDVLETRRRPGFEAVAEAATWDFTVFGLTGAARRAYACVPGTQLARFLSRLDAGALDGLITGFLDAPPAGQVLTAHEETLTPGLWDDAVIGPDLLPYEQPAAEAALDPSPSLTYLRRGKGVVVVAPPAAPVAVPISAPVTPAAATPPMAPAPPQRPPIPAEVPPADVPPAPSAAPTPAQPRPPAVEHRRRRGLVLAGALLVLLLAAGAAALSGAFSGGKPAAVEVVTGSTSPTVTVATPTTGAATSTTMTEPATTTTVPPTAPRPTAVTAPTTVTTAPVETTLRTTTTVPTTTVTVPPPTQLVAAVTPAALGCSFQPSTATVTRGSAVRFRNDTGDTVSIAFVPPAGGPTLINLDQGGTSGPILLGAPGSYLATCTPGGVTSRMTITVT